MARIELTQELAFAASMDAGNRAMRAGGRKAWSEKDKFTAAREFNRLWPLCPHKMAPDDLCIICDQDSIPIGHPLSRRSTVLEDHSTHLTREAKR
jgi:hypothetical protein